MTQTSILWPQDDNQPIRLGNITLFRRHLAACLDPELEDEAIEKFAEHGWDITIYPKSAYVLLVANNQRWRMDVRGVHGLGPHLSQVLSELLIQVDGTMVIRDQNGTLSCAQDGTLKLSTSHNGTVKICTSNDDLNASDVGRFLDNHYGTGCQ
jgi:hypothetical protein